MKKIWKHGSTVALIIIIIILIIPTWRTSFQGWVQGIFMRDLAFETTMNIPITPEVAQWDIKDMSANSTLFNTYAGKPVVLSFWATWCPPCRAELKELKALKEEFGARLTILSVSDESIETIKKSGLHETYDFLYQTDFFPSFFEVQAYPTIVILNKDLELVFKHSGAGGLTHQKNIDFLNNLIEKK